MRTPKVLSKETVLQRMHRQRQRAKAVYFFTGEILPSLSLPRLATSSATCTERTLYVHSKTNSR